ncbi:putative RNA-binding protein 11 [Scleropages formosus]|uniref:Putative RNA-binding protein 11 n=1 Tax=Scleropages formosus TaxID=113540 RepID=A0A0N8JVA9_SCLFO|nr:putative RNA-binding protein 11 [Scleropages formosus]
MRFFREKEEIRRSLEKFTAELACASVTLLQNCTVPFARNPNKSQQEVGVASVPLSAHRPRPLPEAATQTPPPLSTRSVGLRATPPPASLRTQCRVLLRYVTATHSTADKHAAQKSLLSKRDPGPQDVPQFSTVTISTGSPSAGPLKKVAIARDKEGQQKSYGFVCFKHRESVPYAIALLDGIWLYGQPIRLKHRYGLWAELPAVPPRCTPSAVLASTTALAGFGVPPVGIGTPKAEPTLPAEHRYPRGCGA